MKKPHSLYLSALAHNRLSAYVDNALDGAGSLNGFFAFIEERTEAALGRQHDVPLEHPANQAFESLSLLDYRDRRQPLMVYEQAWEEFSTALPWFTDNPAGAHILALNLLVEFPSLWEAEYERRDLPRHQLYAHAVSLWAAIERIRDPYLPAVPAADRASSGWLRARPILGRDRIDFIVADRQVPVSIYLDTDAHESFYRAFGNRFFTRLEHALIHLLEDPEAVLDVESAALFLEVGPGGVDLDELDLAASEIPRTIVKYESLLPVSKADRLSETQVSNLAKKQGYSSLQDPLLLSYGLHYIYLRKRDIERTQGLDIWYMWPEVAEGTLATLHLGNRLKLIDGTDIRQLPQRIVVKLAERFGITHVAPTRDNVFRLLETKSESDDPPMNFGNAVDFHMWALFTTYARHCLSQLPAGHPRVSHSTLATLSESDLFPRVGTIEAFTGTKVRKVPSGTWQLRRGRTIHAALDHQTFLRIGEALFGLLHLRDPITVQGDWVEPPVDLKGTTGTQQYSFMVSPTVIERVLRVLANHDEKARHQALKDELLLEQPRQRQAGTKGARNRA